MHRIQLTPEDQVRLSQTSLSRFLANVILDWTIIIVAFIAFGLTFHPLIGILAILIIGTRQHALAIMAHDGAHFLAAKQRFLNESITVLTTFWPLTTGMMGYRKFHFAHHSHTGTPEDPELAAKKLDSPYWDIPTTRGAILRSALKDLTGLNIRTLLSIMQTFTRAHWTDIVGPLLWWLLVGGVLIYFGFWWVIIMWFVALETAFLACFHLRIWSEHIGTDETHRLSKPRWWQRFIFLPHNTWYHQEHHEWPTIPQWRLPEARHFDQERPIFTLEEVIESYQTAKTTVSGNLSQTHII